MIRNREFQQLRVVVVGQGYVGPPLAVRAAEVGHQVVGFDVDAQRVKRLVLGESYIIPPISNSLVWHSEVFSAT